MAAEDDDGSNQAELVPIAAAAFEELLKAKLGELLPEPKKQEVTRVVHEVVAASFHGPLPPPSILGGYDDITDRWYSMVGLLAGWTTAMALAGGAVVAAAYDQPVVGSALAAASATGMVWKLVQGRSDKPEQQAELPKQVTKSRENRGRSKRR